MEDTPPGLRNIIKNPTVVHVYIWISEQKLHLVCMDKSHEVIFRMTYILTDGRKCTDPSIRGCVTHVLQRNVPKSGKVKTHFWTDPQKRTVSDKPPKKQRETFEVALERDISLARYIG